MPDMTTPAHATPVDGAISAISTTAPAPIEPTVRTWLRLEGLAAFVAGLAIYGAAPSPAQAGLLRPVVRVEARVIQVRSVAAGAGVGYGHAFTAARPSRIATLAMGYADGWPRRLGGRSSASFEGRAAPIVGRVSMDSLTVDVTDLPPGAVREGGFAELIGPHAPLEAVAEAAGTIPYEILTGLGPRLGRVYVGVPETSKRGHA